MPFLVPKAQPIYPTHHPLLSEEKNERGQTFVEHFFFKVYRIGRGGSIYRKKNIYFSRQTGLVQSSYITIVTSSSRVRSKIHT